MGDPLAREIGRVDDGTAAVPITVGVDHGRVTIGCGAIRWHLVAEQADELAALLAQAREEAGGG